MSIRTIAVFLVFVRAVVAAEPAAPRPLLVIEPTPGFPRHSEGDVIEFSDGRLGLIYSRFTGGAQDHAQADIVLRTADPAGTRWDDARVLIPRGDADNVMSVSTVQLPTGEWLLFHLKRFGWNNMHLFVQRTHDEFATLSEPVRVTAVDGYHVVNNDRVIRTSTGRLVVPSALHPCPDGTRKTWNAKAVPVAFISDDDGRTWRRAAECVRPPLDTTITLQEPGVVELADGRIMMWLRTSTPVPGLLRRWRRSLDGARARSAGLGSAQPREHPPDPLERRSGLRVERPLESPGRAIEQTHAALHRDQPRRRENVVRRPADREQPRRLVLLYVHLVRGRPHASVLLCRRHHRRGP